MRDGLYFGAGPAYLPTKVLEQAALDLLEYQGSGVGVGEMSHRSKDAFEIVDKTVAAFTHLLKIPDTHRVLFIQGGGTGGFAAVAYNMLAAYAKKTGKKGSLDYIVTGRWSGLAYGEAQRLPVNVNLVVDARTNAKVAGVPPQSEWNLGNPEETAYVYYCDNETVDGVEFPEPPKVDPKVWLVADVSSNLLSRKIDFSRHAIVFGGVQKNVGIAGLAVYIVHKDILEQPSVDELKQLGVPVGPTMFDFTLAYKQNSIHHTLPLFPLQVVRLVTEALIGRGGVEEQEKIANTKATRVYGALDARPELYVVHVKPPYRSRMNVVFGFCNQAKEDAFLKLAAERNLKALKGHRSVGGVRASIYNAVEPEAVDKLVELIEQFD